MNTIIPSRQHPFIFRQWRTSVRRRLAWLVVIASLLAGSAYADQDIDLSQCTSTPGNEIDVTEDAAGDPAPFPACLEIKAGEEINWKQLKSKEFRIKFVKHSRGSCNDTADDDEKEHDSAKGKLKKKGPNRVGCFHYRIKFKGGKWIDPVIIIRPK